MTKLMLDFQLFHVFKNIFAYGEVLGAALGSQKSHASQQAWDRVAQELLSGEELVSAG